MPQDEEDDDDMMTVPWKDIPVTSRTPYTVDYPLRGNAFFAFGGSCIFCVASPFNFKY
jgi:hypothetical protein